MRHQPRSHVWILTLALVGFWTACATDPAASGSDAGAGAAGAGAGQTGGAATGGSAPGAGGIGTGGAANGGSSTGGTTSGNDFAIDGGFVTVCDWSGFAWTAADDASTVSPSGFGSVDTGEPLCMQGNVAPEPSFGGYAVLGVNLGQQAGSSSSSDIAPGGTGVYVDADNLGGSELRIQIQNAAGDAWCEVYSGPDFYEWSGFNQNCWDDSGSFYANQPVNAIVMAVPGHNASDTSFEVCLNSFSCHDPSTGTGGSGGTAGNGGKFVGNITTQDAVNTNGRTFSTYWDQITPENAGKWGSVEFSPGNRNWGTLDAIYDYAQDNGIVFKQHAFVWGNQQPDFTIGETEVKSWMNAFCSRYPQTALIDVVNEPPPHTTPAYANAIGGGTNSTWQWIINSFVWAHEACPNAVLILNDFNNIEWDDDNQHFIDIVTTLQAANAPIDAVGAQAHDLDLQDFEIVKALLNKLHNDTGLPVYITEYDPSTTNDSTQLGWYQEHIPYFLAQDYVPGITIWGWIYGQTWELAPYSGLIRDGSPRPAMTWLMQELGRPAP